MTLSELKEGDTATVARVGGQGDFRRRLLEMGILKGTDLYVEKYAPLKDPIELIVKGAHVSLRVEEAAQQISDAVSQAEVPAQEAPDPMRAAFEQLQVQLTLGWAEGRDAYAAQKQKIQESIGVFEAEADRASAAVDQKTREALDGLKREFVAQADALDAELTAVEVQYVEEKDKVKAEWASQKQAVEEQIEKFKAELEAKCQAAPQTLETF